MKSKIFNITAFVLGLGLLGYFIYLTNPQVLWTNLKTIGIGFGWVVLIFQVEVMFEVGAWYLSIRPDERAGYWTLFASSVAGSSLNALLPGGQAGEVLKGTLIKDHVSSQQIISSLVIFNFLYTVTTISVLAFATILCIAWGNVSTRVAMGLGIGVGVSAVTIFMVLLWIRRGMIRDITVILKKIPVVNRFIKDSMVTKAEQIDHEIKFFRQNRPVDFFTANLFLVMARILGITEVWAIIFLLKHPVGFPTAAGIFAAGQLFYYVALFLPTRMGVLEGGAILIFKLFGLQGSLGLATEVIRRIRKLFFSALGMLLMLFLITNKKSVDEVE